MKKFTIALLIGMCGSSLMNAQLMLSEDFTANSFTNSTSWIWINNTPSPNLDWFQGSGTQTFPAYNGGPNDYVAANWASTSNTTTGQTLSNWLITPTVTLMNGAVLQFATRTVTNPAQFADRLEVYLSTAGTGANVGTTPTSLGTFSVLVTSINPNLTLTGYPGVWTVYTTVLSGLAGPTPGRFGFRYHVTNGGWGGANSNYIGLDAVRYYNPCGLTVNSYTTCAGQSVTLTAAGAWTTTSYTWTPGGGNSPTVVVNPGSTTTYTLSYEEGGNGCPDQTATVTIGSTLNVNVTASSSSICPGGSATLTASGAASSYTWVNNMAQSHTIAVTPGSSTTYSVIGSSGFCFGGNTIDITVMPSPTVVAQLAPTVICTGKTYTLTATGGVSYIWLLTPTSGVTSNPATFTANLPGPRSYTLLGDDAFGCIDSDVVNFTVNPTPTVTASSNRSITCANESATLTATGGDSYTWSGAGTSTANPFVIATGSTAGPKNYTVTGTSPEGCTSTAVVTVTVNLCSGIDGFDELAAFSVYPNPFMNEIRVVGFSGTIELYNTLGQLMISEKVNGNASIDTADFPKGTYLLKAGSSGGETLKSVALIKN